MKPIRFDDMDTRTQMQMLAVMIAVGTPEQRREAIDFLKLSTLQRRKDGMARSPEYQMAYRAGLRQAVRMLHKDAAEVKDEAARRVLLTAAHGIGVEIGKLRRPRNEERVCRCDIRPQLGMQCFTCGGESK